MPAATYICRFVSPAFRTMIYEEDRQDTVPPCSPRTTPARSLGRAGPPLSVVSAFRGSRHPDADDRPTDVIDDRRSRREHVLVRLRAARGDGPATSRAGRTCRNGPFGSCTLAARPGLGPATGSCSTSRGSSARVRCVLRRPRRHDRGTAARCSSSPASTSSATASTCCTPGRRVLRPPAGSEPAIVVLLDELSRGTFPAAARGILERLPVPRSTTRSWSISATASATT